MNRSEHTIDLLWEARRSPERNPKVGIVDALRPYAKDKNAFISFTDINKLGVNPGSQYKTPLGIYSYPLREMWRDVENNSIPYAGDRKLVHLFRYRSAGGLEVLDPLSSYKGKDFISDIRAMLRSPRLVNDAVEVVDYYLEATGDLRRRIREHDPDADIPTDTTTAKWMASYLLDSQNTEFFLGVEEALRARMLEAHGRQGPMRRMGGTMFEGVALLWTFTREMANLSEAWGGGKRAPTQWNAILRNLGYGGFVDRTGQGLVHPNEPVQGVFLSRAVIDPIETFRNIRPQDPR